MVSYRKENTTTLVKVSENADQEFFEGTLKNIHIRLYRVKKTGVIVVHTSDILKTEI